MCEFLKHSSFACVVAGLIALGVPSPSYAVSPARLTGAISGIVTDNTGSPQMGAAVLLFNRQDRFFQRVLTDERGRFSFPGLVPDLYAVHVTLVSFIPAIKKNILVQPGIRSMLNVSMAGLFSSIQLVTLSADSASFMTDEWKWVLRTASSTRPVLRFLPRFGGPAGQVAGAMDDPVVRRAWFSDTRGLVKLSAGDGANINTFAAGPDLGTEFAVASTFLGRNQVQVSGKLGYGAQGGTPSGAIRTRFSRNADSASGETRGPQVSITMRQLAMPARAAAGELGLPAMRSVSVSFDDRMQLGDNAKLQYGFTMDSVSFVDRLNYFSPYARLSYSLGTAGDIELTYTSGNARPELGSARPGSEAEMQQDVRSLAYFPRVTLRGGQTRVQRGQEMEASYARTLGSRTFRATGYREAISNMSLMVTGAEGMFGGGDLLPDMFSGSSIFNAGSFQTLGYTLSATQALGEHLSAALLYGSVGALAVDRRELETGSPDELRQMIHAGRKHAVTLRTSGTLPASGTHFVASYQWADARWSTPGHIYSTQANRPAPGMNLTVRQPIPTFGFLPWRMEATADLQNLLAQGYLPITAADGRRLLLVQSPRAFRGGLAFIF